MRAVFTLVSCLLVLACASPNPNSSPNPSPDSSPSPNPSSQVVPPDTFDQRARMGRQALAEHRFEDAYVDLAEAMQLAPDVGLSEVELADLFAAFGRAARETRHFEEALRASQSSLSLLREAGDDQRVVQRALLEGALIYRDVARPEEAETIVRRYLALVEASQETAPLELARAWNLLAGLLMAKSDLDGSAKLWRESLELQRAEAGGGDPALLSHTLSGLAEAELGRGRFEEAGILAAESVALGEQSPRVRASGLGVQARIYAETDRLEEAERLLLESLDLLESGPPGGALVAARAVDAASLVFAEGERFAELRQIVERAVARSEGSSPAARVLLGRAVTLAGRRLEWMGHAVEAQALFFKGREIVILAVGPNHPAIVEPSLDVVSTLLEQGRLDEANDLARDVLSLTEKLGPRATPDRVRACLSLGSVAARRGDPAAADAAFRMGLEVQEDARRGGRSVAPPDIEGRMLALLGQSSLRRGQLEEGERYLRRAVEVLAQDPERPEFEASTRVVLASYLLQQRQEGEAVDQAKRALELFERAPGGASSGGYALAVNMLSRSLLREGKAVEAEAVLQRAVERMEEIDPAPYGSLANTYGLLSQALGAQGRLEESVVAVDRAVEVLDTSQGVPPLLFAGVLTDVASSQLAMGREKEAEKLYLRSLAMARLDPDYRRSDVFARSSQDAALFYLKRREFESALSLLRESRDAYELAQATGNVRYLLLLESLAQVEAATGNLDEAADTAESLVSTLEERSSGSHQSLPQLREWAAQLREQARRAEP